MNAADPFGLVGQVLDGQFRVDKLVGEGGFSVVYRGHHQGLNEPIAIKCLKLPAALGTSLVETFVQRFRDESRILYRLSQGNLHVVRSIAAGTTQAPATGALVPYMVLEWLEGRSLQSDFIVRRTVGEKGRSIEEVLEVFATAADGLAYAHSQGVVHRDLNPGNLFLANTQHGVQMKVLDFGVAKLMHEGALDMGPRAQTMGQIKIFAPAYGAPEQFDDRIGAVGAASDVYSFALILLEALRDKNVVEGTHLGEFARITCDPGHRPTPRALGIDVPDEVEQAFARATTLDPLQRWHTAGDFWKSLDIAMKFATERKYENAARETPPLAMGGPPPAAALKRTMPLSPSPLGAASAPSDADKAGLPRPGPGASRPRVPTTIGIPLPSTGPAPPGESDEYDADVATRVHAPAPDVLQTLALHKAVAAKNAAAVERVAALSPAAGRPAAGTPPPPSPESSEEGASLEAAALDGTLMMSPAAHAAARAAVAAAVAAQGGAPPGGAPPAVPSQGPSGSPAGLNATLAMQPAYGYGSAIVPPVNSLQPGGGPYGGAPSGAPSGAPPGAPFGGAPFGGAPFGGAPYGAAPHGAPQGHAPFGQRASTDPPFPPASFAPGPNQAAAPKSPFPVIPIAVGLAVLALAGGLLGIFALRARRVAAPDASAMSASVDPASLTPVPVPVPVPMPTEAATVPSVATDVDAATAAAAGDAVTTAVAASAAASPPSTTTAATTTAPAFTSPPPAAAPTAIATPTPTAVPKPVVDPNAFNEGAARTRLAQANGVLVICQKGSGVTGAGSASVTFSSDGTVSAVSIDPPYAGTKEGDCAAAQFRRAKIGAFTGAPHTLRHSFEVPK